MKNFILFLLALLLFCLISPIAIIFKLMVSLKKRNLSDWFKRLALSLDQLGNVVADEFFNYLLIKKDKTNPFGSEDETISSVLGKNYKKDNLRTLGRSLRVTLHKLDPNHSVQSIEEDEGKPPENLG